MDRLADEVAGREGQLRILYGAAGDGLARGVAEGLELLFGSERDDVRERGPGSVADAPRTLRTRRVGSVLRVPLVPRFDFEAAGERTAQRLVCSDQVARPLVDLPALAVATLVDRLRLDRANHYTLERGERDADEAEDHRLTGTEIEIPEMFRFFSGKIG